LIFDDRGNRMSPSRLLKNSNEDAGAATFEFERWVGRIILSFDGLRANQSFVVNASKSFFSSLLATSKRRTASGIGITSAKHCFNIGPGKRGRFRVLRLA